MEASTRRASISAFAKLLFLLVCAAVIAGGVFVLAHALYTFLVAACSQPYWAVCL